MSVEVVDDQDRLPLPDTVVPGRIAWLYVSAIVLVHLIALTAFLPWLFSWTGVVVLAVTWLLGGFGITLCYHRVLAHGAAKLPKWLEHSLVVVALCQLEGTPAHWVATHRYHHSHSDHREDPHSPLVAFLWAHVGWLCVHNSSTHNISTYAKYAPDILQDRFYMRLQKSHLWYLIYLAQAGLFFLAGFAAGAVDGNIMAGLQLGLSVMVWGVFVRTVLQWHTTWSVNSLTHLYGYRTYKTDDHSRNNWLIGLVGLGEGWHNNHHADPASASNQHRWWEIDVTYYVIVLLERLGLASDVVAPRHIRQAQRARKA